MKFENDKKEIKPIRFSSLNNGDVFYTGGWENKYFYMKTSDSNDDNNAVSLHDGSPEYFCSNRNVVKVEGTFIYHEV